MNEEIEKAMELLLGSTTIFPDQIGLIMVTAVDSGSIEQVQNVLGYLNKKHSGTDFEQWDETSIGNRLCLAKCEHVGVREAARKLLLYYLQFVWTTGITTDINCDCQELHAVYDALNLTVTPGCSLL